MLKEKNKELITDNAQHSISFDNTEIAFKNKSDKDLKRGYWLFKIVASSTMVKIGKYLAKPSMYLGFKPLLKKTIFKQFCGGENIDDCNNTIENLAKFKIGTILDFSVEGKTSEKNLDDTRDEIIRTTIKAKGNDMIPFCVFKVTGVIRFEILEKVTAKAKLTEAESQEWDRAQKRVEAICNAAAAANKPIFIDAEETWIQIAIDDLTVDLMKKINRGKTIVFNTYQLYRNDRYDALKKEIENARKEGYLVGAKLVRGAYMEKERDRAKAKGYASPIHIDKNACDDDYNRTLELCVNNIDIVSFCNGTHNEKSSLFLTELMKKANIEKNDKRIYFAQLLGMSDHISYNLANAGYNVAKYVPYGPLKEVLPYLIRRAEENTSVKGQTGRELGLIIKEQNRRKKLK